MVELPIKQQFNFSFGEQPIKSVRGIIGIGTNVKQHPYTCNICEMKECIYRNRKRH